MAECGWAWSDVLIGSFIIMWHVQNDPCPICSTVHTGMTASPRRCSGWFAWRLVAVVSSGSSWWCRGSGCTIIIRGTWKLTKEGHTISIWQWQTPDLKYSQNPNLIIFYLYQICSVAFLSFIPVIYMYLLSLWSIFITVTLFLLIKGWISVMCCCIRC